MEIVKLLNEIIMKGAPSTIVEVMRQQVRELSQVIQNDWFATNSLRDLVVDLQELFDATLPHGILSSISSSGDSSPQTSDRQISEMRPPQRYTCSWE